MQPTRIHMSDTLRDAFIEALQKRSRDAQHKLDAISLVHTSLPRNYTQSVESRAVSDAVCDVCQTSQEAQTLLNTIIDVAAGKREPAMIIENLPEDLELADQLLSGIRNVMAGDWPDPTRKITVSSPEAGSMELAYKGPSPTGFFPLVKIGEKLDQHARQKPHQDPTMVKRQAVSSSLRMLHVRNQSNPPLSTVTCDVEDMVSGIAEALHDEYYSERYESIAAFEDAIRNALASQTWCMQDRKDATALIIPNKDYCPEHPASCAYSFADIDASKRFYTTTDSPLHRDIQHIFLEILEQQKHQSDTVLHPTEALIFNNALLLHGAGRYHPLDPSKPEHKSRTMYDYTVHASEDGPLHEVSQCREHGIAADLDLPNPANVRPYCSFSKAYLRELEARANAEQKERV